MLILKHPWKALELLSRQRTLTFFQIWTCIVTRRMFTSLVGESAEERRSRSPAPGTSMMDVRLPRFSSSLVDSQVPVGGTLALQVQVTGKRLLLVVRCSRRYRITRSKSCNFQNFESIKISQTKLDDKSI